MTLQQLLFDDTVDQVSLVEDCGYNDLSFVKFGGEAVADENIVCPNPLQFVKFGDNNVDLAFMCPDRLADFKLGGNDAVPAGLVNVGLKGATVTSINRIGDLSNKMALGSAGVYMSKASLRDGSPYYRQYIDGVLFLIPTHHFLKELRRQLSGEVTESYFGEIEQLFYEEYIDWLDGGIKEDELLLAVVTLDKWLTDEVMNVAHPELIREYSSVHKWMKLGERTA